MATHESKSALVAPILTATPTVISRISGRYARHSTKRPCEPKLTALEHLVGSFADQVQTDDLLLLADTDELERGRLLVVLVHHGE